MRSAYDGLMPAITIRNVPQRTRDELAAKAKRAGQSLQEYLSRELEDLASRKSREEFFDERDRDVRVYGTTLSSEQILDAVHADRRA